MGIIYSYDDRQISLIHSVDEIPSQSSFFMHAHEFNELYYFISGNGKYCVEGNEYDLVPGCILLMRASETHMLRIKNDQPYERIALHFPESLLIGIDPEKRLLRAYSDRPIGIWNRYTPDELGFDPGIYLFNMAVESGGEYNKKLAVLSKLCPLLYDISKCFNEQRSHLKPETSSEIIAEIIEYINSQLFSDISLDALSKQFFISKSYLNRRFKQATGCTVWDYVLIKRLLVARENIKNGQSATKVYSACGFNDYSGFYRQYKERFGVSPKEDKMR